jgi:hypothetical protein
LKKTEENKEIEKAKEYYANKNEEVEALLNQIMKGGKEGAGPHDGVAALNLP